MSKILCQISLSSDARTLPRSQGIMNALRRLAVGSHSSSPPTLLHSYWAISVSLCIIHSFNTTASWFPDSHYLTNFISPQFQLTLMHTPQTNASQTLMCIQVTQEPRSNADSDSVDLRNEAAKSLASMISQLILM